MFMLGAVSQQSSSPPTLLPKLISWWDMDEVGTNVTRYDSHGSNDLTCIDGVSNVTGLIGNAAQFDGNAQAQAPNDSFTGTGSFSCVAFVHPTVRSAFDFIYWRCWNGATGASVPGDWDVGITAANQAHFRISFDGSYNDGDGDVVLSSAVFVVDETHWVYAHYDSATGEMAICADNETLTTATLSHTFYTNGDTLRLGRLTSAYPNGLQGWLDCCAVFNGPLTAQERTWLYNGGAGRSYSDF